MSEVLSHMPTVVGFQEVQSTTMGWGDSTTYPADHAHWLREQLRPYGYEVRYVCGRGARGTGNSPPPFTSRTAGRVPRVRERRPARLLRHTLAAAG